MFTRSRRGPPTRRVPASSPRTRLRMEFLEDRLAPATFIVTNTADAGAGSLRWAINHSNASPGGDIIAFDIPGDGVHTIAPTSALPAITDRVTIAGHTQPGFAGTPLIELSGNSSSSAKHGLVIAAGGSGSVVRKLVINRFENNGIRIEANDCLVAGCFIGTDAAGTSERGNWHGVSILPGSSGNVIGGTSSGARNVISGNRGYGVVINGIGSTGNVVRGNFIGTDSTGTSRVGNHADGVIIFRHASGNIVGGTATGAGNVISGNFTGTRITGGSSANQIQGNFIGTDVTGTMKLGNEIGVFIGGASGNSVGGDIPGAGNVISGNGTSGVQITRATSGNRVEGNFIGTDMSGTAALGNSVGVIIKLGATANVVGGIVAGARNVISGNTRYGVEFSAYGPEPSVTTGNAVLGNFIGTDVSGSVALGNSLSGVFIGPSLAGETALTGNVIGGRTAGAGNVISGNGGSGVEITGTGTTGNRIQGNRIGLAATGGATMDNGLDGIHIDGGARGNVVGGTRPGTGNVIAYNGGSGVAVVSGTRNAVLGNRMFDNGGLGIDLGPAGVTPNDVDDPDIGANRLFNFPLLDVARQFFVIVPYPGPGVITQFFLRVRGSINTETDKTLRIEFFASPAAGPSEGARFLGATTVTTGSANTVSFNAVLRLAFEDEVVTATATDELGNTSEFSAPVTVTPF